MICRRHMERLPRICGGSKPSKSYRHRCAYEKVVAYDRTIPTPWKDISLDGIDGGPAFYIRRRALSLGFSGRGS